MDYWLEQLSCNYYAASSSPVGLLFVLSDSLSHLIAIVNIFDTIELPTR